MNDNISDIELQEDDMIMKYLRGQMTDEEEDSFIKELSGNPELKAKAVSMARLAKGLHQVGISRDNEVKEALCSTDADNVTTIASNVSQTRSASVIPIRQIAKWMSAVAASVMVFFVGYQTAEYVSDRPIQQGTQFNRGGSYDDFVEYEVTTMADMIKSYIEDNDRERLALTIEHLELLWNMSNRDSENYYTEYRTTIGLALAEGYEHNGDKPAALRILEELLEYAQDEPSNVKTIKEHIRKLKD